MLMNLIWLAKTAHVICNSTSFKKISFRCFLESLCFFLYLLIYVKIIFFSLASAGRPVTLVKRKNYLENGQVNQLMLVIFNLALNPLIHNTPEGSDAY